MKRSDRRILTSHVGSLPRPEALIEINRAKFAGEVYDQKTYAARLSTAVEQICRKQVEIASTSSMTESSARLRVVPSTTEHSRATPGGASAAGSPESRAASRRSPAGGTGPYLMNCETTRPPSCRNRGHRSACRGYRRGRQCLTPRWRKADSNRWSHLRQRC
jgi:hypothetical protein